MVRKEGTYEDEEHGVVFGLEALERAKLYVSRDTVRLVQFYTTVRKRSYYLVTSMTTANAYHVQLSASRDNILSHFCASEYQQA